LIAVIADIHANLPALEAVLGDVAALGASEIIVNGDLVNRGPSNVAVVERILNLGCARALTLGNHDDLMRKWVERAPDIPAFWLKTTSGEVWRGRRRSCGRRQDRRA
jgi:predicted phosphodiesterase